MADAIGVLGVDTAFDRRAADLNLALFERQRLARRDTDALLDQIGAGDHLGDAVLDLNAGVHLNEIELAASARRNSTVPTLE